MAQNGPHFTTVFDASEHMAAAEPAPALTGARAELVKLNAQIVAAGEALERCQIPVRRLRDLIDDRQRIEQILVSERSRFDGIVGGWIARGAVGARPEPGELTFAERAYADATEDARIAAAAIPTHEAVASEAAAHLNELVARREQMLRSAILEIVADHLSDGYLPAMRIARQHEKDVWDVADALTQSGDARTAESVIQRLRDFKARLALPTAEPARGATFLRQLLIDPGSARLDQ